MPLHALLHAVVVDVRRRWEGVKHTSAIIPTCSNMLSEKSSNARFTLLRQCFVINFIFYEPLCLWRFVKQNEEGNHT